MSYFITHTIIYSVSVILAMLALSCFRFDQAIHKGKIKEFHLFYIMASIALGYLFASFILDFASISLFT